MFFFKKGAPILCNFKPSKEKRVLSEIHSSFNKGTIRITSVSFVSTLILDPILSQTSIVSTEVISQGRATNAYGFEVNAPTGHKSITLPDNSEQILFVST